MVGVLDFLAEALNGKRWVHPPHLTIQGPFSDRPTGGQIEGISAKLKNDTFLIANPGLFRTRKGVALYLRVQSDNLHRVWNKPDFPIEKFGFNPHITLYDGPDVEKTQRAFDFLKSGRHRIELICREFSVAPYTSKQLEMFPANGVEGDDNALERLIGAGKVTSSFRASFLSAVKD